MAFDPTRPVRTRAGEPARIICMDAKGNQPIVALVSEGNAQEFMRRHSMNGTYREDGKETGLDLVNIPQKRSGWVNVYVTDGGVLTSDSVLFGHRKDADRAAGNARIACLHIEFEEGEGL